jgi:hypothetical protein
VVVRGGGGESAERFLALGGEVGGVSMVGIVGADVTE